MAKGKRVTRWARVQAILDRAAGQSAADYGGIGRFWELPLDRLEELELEGERLIAPVVEGAVSCCGSQVDDLTGQRPDETTAAPSRGARSALVRGLRAESPFDGSRYPRLPWGGDAVAPEDIQFISDWIDDGCPPSDSVVLSYAVEGLEAQPELEQIDRDNAEVAATEAFTAWAGSPGEYKYQQGELRQRVNIDCMGEVQLDKLRFAFRELYNLNRWTEDSRSYNSMALIHQNHCQHGWERFLPWHRIYMYEFEQALQDVCPDVTMPYWDWTMKHYRPRKPETGRIIPRALKAFLTKESIASLKKADPPLPARAAKKLEPMIGRLYASQHRFFNEVARLIGKEYTQGEHRNRFIDALLASNALWYPLRYPGEYRNAAGDPSTLNRVIHYHYPTADDIAQILSLNNFRDFGGGSMYNDSFGFLDQNPHNTMHLWTGGQNPDASASSDFVTDLDYDRNRGVKVAGRQFHSRSDLYSQPALGDMFSNLTASYDPIFWPVHANVDRLWWEWQQSHPHARPADLDSVLTPWSYTIRDTLEMHRFGYEYVKCSFIIPVGLEAPVGRFVSAPIEIPDAVRGSFDSAEIRLHRVPQLPRSCFIRVFLNEPDADAQTPIDDDRCGYAGYLAVFGHGPCYGGPGHCELPPRRPRQFDHRPRSHNTPRNHRINVTDRAKSLLKDGGATTLQITLVVIGADYREDKDLLRLEGVSLNFLD